ncbi:MAG: hypothetical protein CVT60_05590 [Actinobacteria bacterium HGW-Actinobacteria-10]|nr:MAG: hypothetical protein CVT60_05590 [Actinobacteria bacterium HGW-Actinobacteria-10]
MDERGIGLGRSLAYGALAGLLAVLAASGYLWYRASQEPRSAGIDDVILVLALPDEEGVVLPRVIVRVREGESESVDPLSEARIPGTSYNVLREAYPFSGADGLASALAGDNEVRPSYVLIDEQAWDELASGDSLEIDIPEQIDVFDGERLYTFREGEQRIRSDQFDKLLNGADYLNEADRASVREQIGAALLEMIAGRGIDAAETDLTAEEIDAWLAR